MGQNLPKITFPSPTREEEAKRRESGLGTIGYGKVIGVSRIENCAHP
jgi:hypothetical protein